MDRQKMISTVENCKVVFEFFKIQSGLLASRLTKARATVIVSYSTTSKCYTVTVDDQLFEFEKYKICDTFLSQGKLSVNMIDHNCCMLLTQHDTARGTTHEGLSSNSLVDIRDLFSNPIKFLARTQINKENITSSLIIKNYTKSSQTASKIKIKALSTSRFGLAPNRLSTTTNCVPKTHEIKTTPSKLKSDPMKRRAFTSPTDTKSTPNLKTKKLNTPLLKRTPRASPHKKTVKASIELSPQQLRIVKACTAGHNVFYSGGAGTGKSYLLHHIIKALQAIKPSGSVFVTATTGLSACSIGGSTLHQFAGVHRIDGGKEEWVREASSNSSVVRRWRQASVLIVDEISMLSYAMLETLDKIGQHTRASSLPLGGLQVVFCGDFFQLPPVENDKAPCGSARFCFASPTWTALKLEVHLLKRVYRQSDNEFASLLEEIRWGRVQESTLRTLNQAVCRPLRCDGDITATHIYTHRNDVDNLNVHELSKLKGSVISFKAQDAGDASYLRVLQSHCPAKAILTLKEMAQVILVKTINLEQGLVNGLRGVIVRFEKGIPLVKFSNEDKLVPIGRETFSMSLGGLVVAKRFQIPLDLAWGISVHKSQGLTLERAVLHLKKVFEYGQSYVALSRVKSIEGLSLDCSLTTGGIRAHPDVIAYYNKINCDEDGDEE